MSEVSPQIDQLQANVQMRRDQARAASTPDVTTDRRPTRENVDVPHSPTNRLMRAALAATLWDIKQDPQMKMDLLPGFVAESRRLAENLDKLDVQYHTNGRTIDVKVGNRKGDVPLPGEHVQPMYVVDLDLNPPKEGEVDTRTRTMLFGGTTSMSEQNATLALAYALEGGPVTITTYPEQMREHAGGRGLLDKISNVGEENVQAFKDVARQVGGGKVDLVGHSFGGAVVIEMASDPEFAREVGINNVISLAPSNFERRNVMIPVNNIGAKFAEQAKVTRTDPESNVAMLEQGTIDAKKASGLTINGGLIGTIKAGVDFMSGGRAAATKRIDADMISRAASNIHGQMEVWVGDKDTVCSAEAAQKVLAKAAGKDKIVGQKVSSYTVEGAYHDTFVTNALGLVAVSKQEAEASVGLDVKSRIGQKMGLNTLKRAASEVLLEKMRKQAVPRPSAQTTSEK